MNSGTFCKPPEQLVVEAGKAFGSWAPHPLFTYKRGLELSPVAQPNINARERP